MYVRDCFFAVLAGLGVAAFAGCQTREPVEPEVERVSPDAEVEVTPEGEVDVEVAPETTPTEGANEAP